MEKKKNRLMDSICNMHDQYRDDYMFYVSMAGDSDYCMEMAHMAKARREMCKIIREKAMKHDFEELIIIIYEFLGIATSEVERRSNEIRKKRISGKSESQEVTTLRCLDAQKSVLADIVLMILEMVE